MFLQNKYTSWYYSIIYRASQRPITGYVENHHIIPKSIGGTNEKDNKVKLTAREHFICHRLLVKMTTSSDKTKMYFAAFALACYRSKVRGNVRVTSRTYEFLKESISSIRKTVPGRNKGKKWTDEQK